VFDFAIAGVFTLQPPHVILHVVFSGFQGSTSSRSSHHDNQYLKLKLCESDDIDPLAATTEDVKGYIQVNSHLSSKPGGLWTEDGKH
jgi:hypothetical protein